MEWRRPVPPYIFETCFFKVELTIILNGFLNIRLSCGRRQCNGDRCPSRLENAQNMLSVWKAWFQFWLKQHHLRIDVLFSYIVIARTTDRLPDTHLKFECNGLDFYFIIIFFLTTLHHSNKLHFKEFKNTTVQLNCANISQYLKEIHL